LLQDDEDDDEDDGESTASGGSGLDFNYILSMALWCLTKEKKDELIKQRDAKVFLSQIYFWGLSTQSTSNFVNLLHTQRLHGFGVKMTRSLL